VTLVDRLPEQWRPLAKEIAKFGAVGGANTVVDFAVFNLMMWLGIPALKANVVSTVVATTTSYGMNRKWTYADRARTALRREYTLFFVFNLVGLAIQLAVLGLVKYGFGAAEGTNWLLLNAAKAFAIGVAMVFRFWAYRTFVFAHPVQPSTAVDVETEFAGLTGALDADLLEAELLDADLLAEEILVQSPAAADHR
jgi:putative flippase GtrA